MRIGFIFGSPKISGGSYVIFQHAVYLHKKGHDVYIILAKTNNDLYRYDWHEAFKTLKFTTIDKINKELDLTIATWWESPFLLWKVKSKQYAYFVQSIEAYFFQKNNIANQYIAHQSYFLGLPIITEATWIKEDLESKYINNIFLVKNGILKQRYQANGPVIDLPKEGSLRCLVEGPINVPFKAVRETIEALQRSKADEIWLLTSSEIDKYNYCNRVFSNIDPSDVPMIMRSCDVIVKQSAVEGMFGPPLEMFHCGGTAVVSNVTGFDEYIIDGKNALVNNIWDFDAVTKNVNLLKENPLFLKTLKKNAMITANTWPDWYTQSAKFADVIDEIMKLPRISRESLRLKTELIYKFADYLRKSCSSQKTIANLAVRFELPKLDKEISFANYILNTDTKNMPRRILGLTISNEHIQEIWHPLIKRLGLEYKYICSKKRGEYTLWDRELAEKSDSDINENSYLVFNWIKESKELFKQIETFAPDIILVHSGNHPAYQKTLREINLRYQIPILFTELGWLPQKYNFYIDDEGTNAKSSIARKSYKDFVGENLTYDENKKFSSKNVLLILQLETDMNFLLNNPYFKSNNELIEYVLKSVPEKYNLIIKPHPLDCNADRYLKFESNRVSINFDSFDNVIKDCNSVIAINSTCLIQALEYPVNIYKCGESILDNKNLAIEFTNKNLKEVWVDYYVNNARSKNMFLEQLRKYQINVLNLENLKDEDLKNNESVKKLFLAKYKEIYDFSKINEETSINPGNRICCTSLESLCQSILNYDVVSLDFFDTLVRYEFLQPNDIHKVISIKVCEIVKSGKFDHLNNRIKAEALVRDNSLDDEVSIDQIYAQYLLLTGLPASEVNQIKKLEIETVKSFIKVREAGKKLFDFAKSANKKVCILSDYYVGGGFIRKCLEDLKFNLDDVDIHVSSEINLSKKTGSLYRFVLNKYRNEKIIHIGDNFKIDLQTALVNGVDASHFPSILDTQKNSKNSFQYLEDLFGRQPLNIYNMEMGLCLSEIIAKRFDNPYKIDRVSRLPLDIHDVGFSLLGPVIYSFTYWLHQQVKEKKITHLLFLSRDGHLLKKAYDIYLKYNPYNVKTEYLYCSRRAMNIISLSFDFSSIKEIVDTRLAKSPLSYFFRKRLNLEIENFDPIILSGTGFNSFEDQIQLPKDKSRILLLCQKLRKNIIKESKRFSDDYLSYIKNTICQSNNSSSTKVGVVDIGYFGSMQYTLTKILKGLDYNEIEGFYFATRKEINFDNTLSLHSKGFLSNKFTPLDQELPDLCRRLGFLEFLLSAPHGSFEGVKRNNSKFEFEFTDSIYESEQWEKLKVLHQDAISFIEKITRKERKLKDLGINYFDGNKIRFDRALFSFLDSNNQDAKRILSGFVLENLYSLEIIPFNAEEKKNVQPVNKKEILPIKRDLALGNKQNNTEVGKSNKLIKPVVKRSTELTVQVEELTNLQKKLISLYKPFVKIIARENIYRKFESDPIKFFYDTKSPFNIFYAKLVNKFGNKVLICKNSIK